MQTVASTRSLTDHEMHAFGDNVGVKWRTTKKVFRNSMPVCCFLEDNSCKIYESRPKGCRAYPFFAICKEDLEALGVQIPEYALRIEYGGSTYFITCDKQCPGIGTGHSHFCHKEAYVF
ncbi:MAG: YkgJ family cysteine cluster protein [Candidatus Methanomethylicaceae archaeon]